MQTLGSALAQSTVAGEPLPRVFPSLETLGFRLRRAQVTMIAGPANAGKSLFSFVWVAAMNLPSLVISADTDQFTTALRAAALSSGMSMAVLEHWAEREGRGVLAQFTDEQFANLRFCFDSSPTLDDIDLEVAAFTEVWGGPPQVIVVDNVMNIVADESDEWRGMRVVMAEMHDLARKSGAQVIVLHHTAEVDGDEEHPPPRKAIQGKISQLPEGILTLHNWGDRLGVAPVKNRTGRADPTGRTHAVLLLDAERMALTDPKASTPNGNENPTVRRG